MLRADIRLPVLILGYHCVSGCSNSTAPRTGPRQFTFRVEVMDSTGAPVPGRHISWATWPSAPASPTQADPSARTDSLGRFTVAAGLFDPPRVDSLRLSILTPNGSQPPHDTLLAAFSLLPGSADTTVIRLVHRPVLPRASAAVGQMCAFEVDPNWGPGTISLGLRVDSVTGSAIYGRWRPNFLWTRGDDFGAFVGTVGSGLVALDLTHDAPWGTCTGPHLAAPVRADGTWGPAELDQAQGCIADPEFFDFVRGSFLSFWP